MLKKIAARRPLCRLGRLTCHVPHFVIVFGLGMVITTGAVAQPATSPSQLALSSVQAEVDVPQSPQEPNASRAVARGRVFIDRNGDGRYGAGDSLFQGIRVSNGHEIVLTDQRGEYELPIDDDSAIFIIKPRGFRTPLDENQLPKFYYLHKPQGSPRLAFPGVAPTGPLPQSIDFPLYPQQEPRQFEVILFGDPQPRNDKEVDYIAQDVVADLIGEPAAFGVTLGDIVFDDLAVFESLNQTVALIGVPWYNVIGNHDINQDVQERKWINETFERHFGPSYYSFDYGQVHFVVMDDIDWEQKENGRMGYVGNFGERQLAFLKRDLELCPPNQMVVLMMHIPLPNSRDCADLYRLIEQRPFCISISGHTHHHEHMYLGSEQGWKGAKPHHHIINVTVSGSWWSGKKDERGIPHTTMADGGPNGCSIIHFDGQDYRLEYRAAGVDRGRQMRIEFPFQIAAEEVGKTPLFVNVFDGSERSAVNMRLDGGGEWIPLSRTVENDPFFEGLYLEHEANPPANEPKLTRPKPSTHLWKVAMPDDLSPGVHLIEVSATDSSGRVHRAQRSVRITAGPN